MSSPRAFLTGCAIVSLVYTILYTDNAVMFASQIALAVRGVDSSDAPLTPEPSPELHHDAIFDTCILAENTAQPWTEEIKRMMKPQTDPLRSCNRDYVPFTVLGIDGRVRIAKPFADLPTLACEARSILRKHDFETIKGDWHKLNENFTFETDFVEVGKETYSWLHYQIWTSQKKNMTNPVSADFGGPSPNESLLKFAFDKTKYPINNDHYDQPKINNVTKPNVYIIIYDSMASTMAQRLIPETVKFLEQEFEAVNFRHMNRVADNSLPNAAAMLFGKHMLSLKRDLYGLPDTTADFNDTHTCKKHIDPLPFILQDYKKAGYKTAMIEDFPLIYLKNCHGFKEAPATHYFKPFPIRVYMEKPPMMRKLMDSRTNCIEPHMYEMDYLEKFTRSYPGQPKMAMLWAAYLIHDDANLGFHADNGIVQYFRRNRRELENSFVFFLSDHGQRLDRTRNTALGRIEINNPMAWISVPKFLRNATLPAMRNSSSKLVTHFDTYATLRDIVELAPNSNFSDLSQPASFGSWRGSSLIRPLPPGPRTCRSLPIPMNYCLCQHATEDVASNSTLLPSMGSVVVEAIKKSLNSGGVGGKCAVLTLDKVVKGKYITNSSGLYEVHIQTKPGGGEFKVSMRYLGFVRNAGNATSPSFVPVSRVFERTNKYGHDGDCIGDGGLRPYCYCPKRRSRRFAWWPWG